MSSRDVRPTSAQSRTAWGGNSMDYGGGHARPDNQFEFGPRGDPDLPTEMENEYMDKEKERSREGQKSNQVATNDKPTGCGGKILRGIRCKKFY